MRRGIVARHAGAAEDTTAENGEDAEVAGYVVHLPVRARSLIIATLAARSLARSLAFLPEFEPGGTTVSREDEQGVHHRVFCDRRLDGRRRCPMSPDHRGPCLDPADPPSTSVGPVT